MNPLTQIKNTQKATLSEVRQGLSDSASWHAKFANSAYVFAGGLSFDLTEGDVLAVFSQYGEFVDVNLVRHEETVKSRGFAFVCYEDQRSTVLAVDNLNGATVLGRTSRSTWMTGERRSAKRKDWRCGAGWRTSSRETTATSAEDRDRHWRSWPRPGQPRRWTCRRLREAALGGRGVEGPRSPRGLSTRTTP